MKVLIIEDDAGLSELVTEKVEECGFQTASVQSAHEALEWLKSNTPFLMILDYSLPDMNGIEFIIELQKTSNTIPPFIVSTGYGDELIAVNMMKFGARDYLIKNRYYLNILPEVLKRTVKEIENENKRKQAEEALIDNQKQLADIITFLPDATLAIDKNKQVIIWNKAIEEMTGIPSKDMIGKGDYVYSIPFYGKARPQLMDLIFLNDEDVASEYLKINKEGDSYTTEVFCNALYNNKGAWVFAKASPLHDQDGNTIGAIEIVRDITERKKMEETLRESEEKYRMIFDYSPLGLLSFNQNGIITACNNNFVKIIGSSFESIIGLNLLQLQDKKLVEATREALLGNNGFYEDLYSSVTSSKSTQVRVLFAPIKYGDGRIQGGVGIIENITERKQAEKNLQKLFRAVEQSQVSIVITDKEAIIEYVNPKFLNVTGYSLDEVMGKNPRFLKSGEFTDYEEMWNVLTSGKEWSGIFHNKKKNGELFWESITISPVNNEQGEITNYVAVKEDITAKKELEINLQQALERAEEVNRLKSNFLANMNHEFRTPLNGILGFAGYLTGELKDKDHAQMASAILSSGKRLSETLNLILDLSNVEAENIEIQSKQIEVITIIKNVTELFSIDALKKNLDLSFIVKEDKIYANLDEQLFPRIIHNLIDNAIKFTEKGSVNIEIGIEQKDENNLFYVKITDTGIGIPKDKIDIIWSAFRQVSEGLDRGYEGTGLGLTIAQKLTGFMQGTIEVNSELGKGSVFVAKFPAITEPILDKSAIKIELDVIAPISDDNKENKLLSVLYIEDDFINQNVVKLFLKNKYLIDTADDALSALQMVQQKKYNIILMDINLGSGMNGIQATQEIRKNKNYLNTPIIATTAFTAAKDKVEFSKAGCSPKFCS